MGALTLTSKSQALQIKITQAGTFFKVPKPVYLKPKRFSWSEKEPSIVILKEISRQISCASRFEKQ